jgi:hypothetical protein
MQMNGVFHVTRIFLTSSLCSDGWSTSSDGCSWCGNSIKTAQIIFITVSTVLVAICLYIFGFRQLFQNQNQIKKSNQEHASDVKNKEKMSKTTRY